MIAAIKLMDRVGLHWLQQAGRSTPNSAQFRTNHHYLSLKSKGFAVASRLKLGGFFSLELLLLTFSQVLFVLMILYFQKHFGFR